MTKFSGPGHFIDGTNTPDANEKRRKTRVRRQKKLKGYTCSREKCGRTFYTQPAYFGRLAYCSSWCAELGRQEGEWSEKETRE